MGQKKVKLRVEFEAEGYEAINREGVTSGYYFDEGVLPNLWRYWVSSNTSWKHYLSKEICTVVHPCFEKGDVVEWEERGLKVQGRVTTNSDGVVMVNNTLHVLDAYNYVRSPHVHDCKLVEPEENKDDQ